MKRLSVLRHAKSSWEDSGIDDFDRPLNERGWKAARRLGRELRHRRFAFDLVIVSPAARARETIDGLTEKLNLHAAIRYEPRLYLASEQTLLEIVRAIPENIHAPLLVGHNPGLQQLVLELTREGKLRDQVAAKFPTAAFAQVELPADRWSTIEPGTGELAGLILAKALD